MDYVFWLDWLDWCEAATPLRDTGFDEAGIHWTIPVGRDDVVLGWTRSGASVEITQVVRHGLEGTVGVLIDGLDAGRYQRSADVRDERLREVLDEVVGGLRARRDAAVAADTQRKRAQGRQAAYEALRHLATSISPFEREAVAEPIPVARLLGTRGQRRRLRMLGMTVELRDDYLALIDRKADVRLWWQQAREPGTWVAFAEGGRPWHFDELVSIVTIRAAEDGYVVSSDCDDLARVTGMVVNALAARLAKLDANNARIQAVLRAEAERRTGARIASLEASNAADDARLRPLLARL